MTTKTIEVRDKGTFIPMLAIRLDPASEADRYLLNRSGYSHHPEGQGRYVLLAEISGGHGKITCYPSDWQDRTKQTTHEWIVKHFSEIDSGAVVDVEFILGETKEPKASEAIDDYASTPCKVSEGDQEDPKQNRAISGQVV